MQSSATRKESAVRERYAGAARSTQSSLCCAVSYDPRYLEAIPAEVVERDYGCGDPSRHLRHGETVLDLGSGTGKTCFIAAQVVGPQSRVIGIDMTDDMLAVARAAAPLVAERIGYANVSFRKGRIQDLALDLEALDRRLAEQPVRDADGYLRVEELVSELRREAPLVADASIDVVVSNCVLNLVEPDAKRRLFSEIFRVLRPGGRAIISDIVSDREVPAALQADPVLWSGCISGALTEAGFLNAFAAAGFQGIRVLEYGVSPWQMVEGIEFRSVTVEATRAMADEASAEVRQLIYRGPFLEVVDDAGRRMRRGERHPVSAADTRALADGPYAGHFIVVESEAGDAALEAATVAPCCN